MRSSSLKPTSPLLAALVLAAVAVVVPACTPDYPSCDSDKNCHDKEFCVEHKCQQCRTSTDCATGNQCNAGKCEAIPGFCRSKSECPGGTKCINGSCTAKKPCKTENDCAQNEDCVEGFCVSERPAAPPPAVCALDPVYFDFNESALTTDATARLAVDGDCLKKVGRAATLTGHTDPRGTQEYNLALSEKRAQSVRDHLGRLGIDGTKMITLPRGALDAKGTDEPSWAQDRRVDFSWR